MSVLKAYVLDGIHPPTQNGLIAWGTDNLNFQAAFIPNNPAETVKKFSVTTGGGSTYRVFEFPQTGAYTVS